MEINELLSQYLSDNDNGKNKLIQLRQAITEALNDEQDYASTVPEWKPVRLLMRDDKVGGGYHGDSNKPIHDLSQCMAYIKEQNEKISDQVNAGFILVSSFEQGATITLSNEVLLYEADGQYYRWTGNLPKVVDPNSTPDASGGIGGGKWVLIGDSSFIQLLKNFDGFKFIGNCASIEKLRNTIPQNEKQLIILRGFYEDYLLGCGVFYSENNNTERDDNGYTIRCSQEYVWKRISPNSHIDPVEFGAIPTSLVKNFDSTSAFQNAIDYASSSKTYEVKFDGEFNILSFDKTFTLPYDDGVISVSEWLTNGDSNIESEAINTIPVSLILPDHVKLSGVNTDTSILKGLFDVQNSGLLLSNGAMFASNSGFDKEVFRIQFSNFTIAKSMIGVISHTMSNALYENMIFNHVGICVVSQGAERSRFINIRMVHCFSGFVFGGWWLQRERKNVSEIRSGWVDACYFEGVQFQGIQGKYVADNENLFYQTDTFFDNYFYKNANSKISDSGGRSSNNVDSYFLQETMDGDGNFNKYHGIESRCVCIFSRYNRRQSSNIIINGKTLYTHRAPFYHNCANQCFTDSIFIERTGYTDTEKLTGSFGATDLDPFSSVETPIVSYGFYLKENSHIVHNPANRIFANISYEIRQPQPGDSPEFTDNTAFTNRRIIFNSGQLRKVSVLERVSLLGDNIPATVKNTNNKLYERNLTHAITQPLHFAGNNASAMFDYNEIGFTPVISINGVDITPTSSYGVVLKYGVLIKCFVNINKSGGWTGYAGNITISNLPFSHTLFFNAARSLCFITQFPSSSISSLAASVSGSVITLREANGISALNANVINQTTSAIQLCIEFTTDRLGMIAN